MTSLPSPEGFDPGTTVVELRSQFPAKMLGVPAGAITLSWSVESSSATSAFAHQLSWSGLDHEWRDAEPSSNTDTLAVAAPGGPVPAGSTRRYRVRVATEKGWSAWSAPLTVETAQASWAASVISAPTPTESAAPYLRKAFTLDSKPLTARLRVSGFGVHDVYLNGHKVGDEHLAPGWTSYQERIVAATHDVTAHLHEGPNVLGAMLGDGWFRGRLGWKGQRNHYGDRLGLIAELRLSFADGSTETITSDGSWTWSTGKVSMASLYDGCDMDLRNEPHGWATPQFDDSTWAQVNVLDVDTSRFVPRIAPPVRTIAELPGQISTTDGRQQVDLGQNIAGWMRIRVQGEAGATVTVRHAEVLESDGALHTAALRTARATDTYVLDRDGEHVLEPLFTFHGFQYAEVEGAELVEATGVAISSDTAPRSHFTSNHSLLNRLHENVVWSQRDNFVSVPTDCPQRDERLGWTGDAQAFAATANTLFDSNAFWQSWLIDLDIDQPESGAVAAVVPNILIDTDFDATGQSSIMGRAGWADAATIVPWSVYESFGDRTVLARQLSSMRRWVAHLEERANRAGDVLLPTEFQFGDWLDPDAPTDRPQDAKTHGDYVANAFFSWSARLLARTERLVGDAERADAADALADRVASATWARFGDHARTTQTGCALAIEFGIAPASEHDSLGRALADLVRAENGRISTGFLGTPLVLPALTRTGYLDEAFLMLTCTDAPSWLYQVERGATTIWERWDAILTDGSINPGDMEQGESMLSFNHYAYGAVIDWVYRNVAGIAPVIEYPGYERVLIAPRPSTVITRASAHIDASRGRVAVEWMLVDDRLELTVTIPFGAEGQLDLPVTDSSRVLIGDVITDPSAPLAAGTHHIVVTAPRVADPHRVLAEAA